MRDLTAAMAQILAANILALRMSRGLNQTEFGEEIGVSQGTVARWEKGAEPKNEPLLKLADMAGCSIEEFTSSLFTPQRERTNAATAEPMAGAILLPVTLPNEPALTEMFQGLLGTMAHEKDHDVIARRLARLLPNALAQTVYRQPAPQNEPDGQISPEVSAQARTTANPASRPSPRT